MTQRKLELVVGLFVALGIAAITFLAVYVGGGMVLKGESRLLQARFTNAGGLKHGGRVDIAGVLVGRIESITLDTKSMTALVAMSVDRSVPIYDDAIVSIRTAGLIGEKFISISPGGGGELLQDGALIVDTESAVDLESIVSRFAFGGAPAPAPRANPGPAPGSEDKRP